MADQKDQAPSSPSQSTDLPIKKRSLTETIPSYSFDDEILFGSMDKKTKLITLQRNAYHYVLHAFRAESLAISNPRIMIVRDLMKELKIDLTTHNAFEFAIKTDPMVEQLRNVSLSSEEREMQKLTAPEEPQITGVDGQPLIIRMEPNKDNTLKIGDRVLSPAKIQDGKVIPPAKIQDEEAKLRSTSDGPPVPSWGQVSPHSLIGKSIGIRIPGEHEYIRFQIEDYDVETETHYLASAFSKKDTEDPCNWVDIRHIPAEDIEWPKKHPKLPEWKCFPEPGETLLHETSTARKKKQLHEVGKTSTGIPIIRKVDKGKGHVQ